MWRAGALPIRTIHLISKWAGEPTELENSKLEIVFFGFVRKLGWSQISPHLGSGEKISPRDSSCSCSWDSRRKPPFRAAALICLRTHPRTCLQKILSSRTTFICFLLLQQIVITITKKKDHVLILVFFFNATQIPRILQIWKQIYESGNGEREVGQM